MPELERLERLYPHCASLAEIMKTAGLTWADVGLTAADGERLDQVFPHIDDV